MRRSHDAFSTNPLSMCPETGATHIRHHVTADGYYKGELIKPRSQSTQEASE